MKSTTLNKTAKQVILPVLVTIFTALVIIGLSTPVYAIQYNLAYWNVTELNLSGDWVKVDANLSGSDTSLAVQWFSGGGSGPTAIGIDKFAYNSTATVITCPAGWDCNLSTGTMDGFGSFAQQNSDSAGTDGISSPVVFVLSGSPTFTTNNKGAMFAAHVRYTNSCSGFVSDGNAGSSVGSDSNCASQVPEPTTFLLLGSGLLGLGLLGRKIKR